MKYFWIMFCIGALVSGIWIMAGSLPDANLMGGILISMSLAAGALVKIEMLEEKVDLNRMALADMILYKKENK